MTSGGLLVTASILAAFSGMPLLTRLVPTGVGQRIATFFIFLAAALGIPGAIASIISPTSISYTANWSVPFGPVQWSIDPLSAFFALPILIVAACCSLYSLGYWPANSNQRTVHKITFFFGLLVAAMLWVIMARSTGLFLFAWEVMALCAYFVLTTESDVAEVRDAGTLYMICTHVSTLALFAMFSLIKSASGSFIFPSAGAFNPTTAMAGAIFLVALIGFGLKSGLMPLHVWLPSAHANAPSHISAIMSGVILKIGIYGLIRTISFFVHIPLWWAIVLLLIGITSGIAGVAFALGQHDIKRLLAYHSIENIGIIVMGLGIALIGRSTGNDLLVLLGMAGALLHVLNHAIFKALLFLSAGSVIHAVGTREIDRMGGLLRPMPWTAGLFLVGAVAICGLPPLNGFVSELLIYLGLFHGVISGEGTGAAFSALATPALALIGGLAAGCFVKVFGVVFLGIARDKRACAPLEAGWSMRLPMIMLAIVCVAIGLASPLIAPLLDAAVAPWRLAGIASGANLLAAAPFRWISLVGTTLALLIAALIALLAARLRSSPLTAAATWGCGYLAPTSRMQYSGSSFAAMFVALFAGPLQPHISLPSIEGIFPKASRFGSHVPETILEKVYIPILLKANERFVAVRRLQDGRLHIYILCVLLTLIVLMAIPW